MSWIAAHHRADRVHGHRLAGWLALPGRWRELDEVRQADRNLEILAASVSELPNPIVFDAPPSASAWSRPLPVATHADVASPVTGCEWVSPTASARLRTP